MKSEIKVFDPPMCCSTGVCGPGVNPKLLKFAGDLDELKQHGVAVTRFNLSSEPDAFVAEPLVKATLASTGNECLPLILANGKIVSTGTYPTRKELMQWAGLDAGKETTAAIKTDATEVSECGPGCACNGTPSGNKMKSVISSIVLIAVLGILGVKFAKAQSTEPTVVPESTAAAFPVS